MAAVIAMLQRMTLSSEAGGEITSATGQGILTIVNFDEMDKEGVDLVICQLTRPGGADAAGVKNPGIKISAIGQQSADLWLNVLLHQEQVKSSRLGSHLRECHSPSSQFIESSGVAREEPQGPHHCSRDQL